MALKNTKLTNYGEEFISYVCSKKGDDLLRGYNGPLPFSDDGNGNSVDQPEWVATPKFNGRIITDSTTLSSALIYWFNEAGQKYGVDPNILAAQSYVESNFMLWYYPDINSQANSSGLNQFTMEMVFSVIVDNFGDAEKISDDDIAKIIEGLENNKSLTAYQPNNPNDNTRIIAKKNRPILHQNIMNNPDVMITAQARVMKYYSDKSNKLASSSLFSYYNRNYKYVSPTYSRTIEKFMQANEITNNQDPRLKNAVDYVLEVWSVLGDKNNNLKYKFSRKSKSFNKKKPNGRYFGYDEIFNFNNISDLTDAPNSNFDSYSANVNESSEYGIDEALLDDLSIARDPRYKFIYFPEDQYNSESEDRVTKTQIVLHHTVSGDGDQKTQDSGVSGDIRWWKSKGEKVATSFIVSRNGDIYQLFSTDFWAWHLGLDTANNTQLNKKSIGIELDSWGGLVEYKNPAPGESSGWYPTLMDSDGNLQSFEPKKNAKPVTNVQQYNAGNGYSRGFRGFYGFESYTELQIKAVRDLILSLVEKYPNISLIYNEDIWDINYNADGTPRGSKTDGAKAVSQNALNGKTGIWTHTSYRKDKSDCHPQPDLINMLRNLS